MTGTGRWFLLKQTEGISLIKSIVKLLAKEQEKDITKTKFTDKKQLKEPKHVIEDYRHKEKKLNRYRDIHNQLKMKKPCHQ